MIFTDQERKARSIAAIAHYGQTYAGGSYFTNHICRVALYVPDNQPLAKEMAWLHDVIEDSHITAINLYDLGCTPDAVRNVAVYLTKSKLLPYHHYMENILSSQNLDVITVKYADMTANYAQSARDFDTRRIAKYEGWLPKLAEIKRVLEKRRGL